MSLHIRTANPGLAASSIHAAGYGSPLVPITLDDALTNHQWRIYDGDRALAPAREITSTVGADVRRAIAKATTTPTKER